MLFYPFGIIPPMIYTLHNQSSTSDAIQP